MTKNLIIALLLAVLLLTWHLRYLQGLADSKDCEFQEMVHEKISKGLPFFVNAEERLVKVYPLKGFKQWNYRRGR